ncbi:MAG TPA: hypothetical protein PK339_12490 [Flavitalea sp.]|nr:hypothetical protein [Flavitalea sp.]
MKNFIKLLIVALLMVFVCDASAQLRTLAIPAAKDTLTNTDTAEATLQAGGTAQSISFQISIEKLSGTAGGTARIYGSHDGVRYSLLSDSVYTITNTTGWQTAIPWIFAPAPVPYYKIIYLTSGSQSVVPRATAVIRK